MRCVWATGYRKTSNGIAGVSNFNTPQEEGQLEGDFEWKESQLEVLR